jgi:hypothetical protein
MAARSAGRGVSSVRGRLSCSLAAGLMLAFGGMTCSWAEESQFAFVSTTDLLPKAAREIAQWVTWRHQKQSGGFDQLESRTEAEYGLTDRLQLALYMDFSWTRAFQESLSSAALPAAVNSRVLRFTDASAEAILRLLSPYTHAVGLALYVQPVVGPRLRQLDGKLIVQRNFLDDRLILGFNWIYAPRSQWVSDSPPSLSGSHWQQSTQAGPALAGSYRFRANWSLGCEFLNERTYNSYWFRHETNSAYFLGPSLHFGGKDFYVTATFLEQLPWASAHAETVPGTLVGGRTFDEDFERYRVRLKAGFYF